MDADSSYGGSDTAQDSHSGHDNSSSLDTTQNDVTTTVHDANVQQERPKNFYHKNEITLPVNYDEADFQENKSSKQPHYLSTANLNINETLEHHSNLEEMNKNYKSTSYLNESPRIREKPSAGVDNPAFQEEEYKVEVKSTFDNNKPYNGDLNSSAVLGLTSPNKNEEPLTEAVNLELINLKPVGKDVTGPYENGTNGVTSIPVKKDNDAEIGNPYDEYFVPVNEHRKYMSKTRKGRSSVTFAEMIATSGVDNVTGLSITAPEQGLVEYPDWLTSLENTRGEKLYVTMDKRNKKKRNKCLCWGLCLCIVAAAVIIGILAAVGIIGNQGPPVQEVSARQFGSSTKDETPITTGGIFGLPRDIINETTSPPEIHTQRFTPGPPVVTVSSMLPTTETSMIQVPRALESQLVIDNLEFTPALANKTSTEFEHLAKTIETELKQSLFSSDILNYGAANIEVKVVGFSPGSVVVKYRITWVFKDGIHNARDPVDEEMLKKKLQNIKDANNGFINTYHISDDKITVDKILDMCKIDNNGCEYNCSFDYKLANFICSCPEGEHLAQNEKTCVRDSLTESELPEVIDKQFNHSETTIASHVEAEPEPEPEPAAEPEPTAEPEPAAEPQPIVELSPAAEAEPTAKPEPAAEPEPTQEVEHKAVATPEPEPFEPKYETYKKYSKHDHIETTSEPLAEPVPVTNAGHVYSSVEEVHPEPTDKPDMSHENYVHFQETSIAGINNEPSPEPTTEFHVHSFELDVLPEPTTEPSQKVSTKSEIESNVVTTTKISLQHNHDDAAVAEPTSEPFAEDSVTLTTVKPAIEEEKKEIVNGGHSVVPLMETPSETTSEPGAEPTPEPTSEPVAETTIKLRIEQNLESITESPVETLVEYTSASVTESSSKSDSESTAQPAAEPSAESVTDHDINLSSKFPVQPVTEQNPEAKTESAIEQKMETTWSPDVSNQDQNVDNAISHYNEITEPSHLQEEIKTESITETSSQPLSINVINEINTDQPVKHVTHLNGDTNETQLAAKSLNQSSTEEVSIAPTESPAENMTMVSSADSQYRRLNLPGDIFTEPEVTTSSNDQENESNSATTVKEQDEDSTNSNLLPPKMITIDGSSESATTAPNDATSIKPKLTTSQPLQETPVLRQDAEENLLIPVSINEEARLLHVQNVTEQIDNGTSSIPVVVNDRSVTLNVNDEAAKNMKEPKLIELTTSSPTVNVINSQSEHPTERSSGSSSNNTQLQATMSESTENMSATDNMSPFLPEIDNDTFVNKLHLGEHVIPNIQNETHDEETEFSSPRRLDNDQMNTTNPQEQNPTLPVVPLEGNENEILDKVTVTTTPKTGNQTETSVPVTMQDVPTTVGSNIVERPEMQTTLSPANEEVNNTRPQMTGILRNSSEDKSSETTSKLPDEIVPTTLLPEIINNIHRIFGDSTTNPFINENENSSNQAEDNSNTISTSTEDLIALETTTNIEKAAESGSSRENQTATTVHAEILETATQTIHFENSSTSISNVTPAHEATTETNSFESRNVSHQYEVNEEISDVTTEKFFVTAKSTTENSTFTKGDSRDLSVVPLDDEVNDTSKRVVHDTAEILESDPIDTFNDISEEEQIINDKFHHDINDLRIKDLSYLDSTTTKAESADSNEHRKFEENKLNKKSYYDKEKSKFEKKVKLEKTLGDGEISTAAVSSDRQTPVFGDIRPVTEDFSISGFRRCSDGQFNCVNGTSVKDGSYCIPENDRCDSVSDCSDASDETYCVKDGCLNNYQCASGQCLKRHLVCDGIQNCNDGSDEVGCDQWTCRSDEFSCGNGSRCLPVMWKCDGRAQCPGESDEYNCPSATCNETSFHCSEQNICVPKTWRCDGKSDCANAEDEKSCECGSDEFKCAIGGGCIQKSLTCDGIDHCPDKSDEWNCLRAENGGDSPKYIEVQVANETWHPICSESWNQTYSDLICQHMGYSGSAQTENIENSKDFKGYFKLRDRLIYGAPILSQMEKVDKCGSLVSISCQEFTCGSHSTVDVQSARIIGGNHGVETQWPSLTLLYNKKRNVQCTATLVAPSWVIASHSCIFDTQTAALPNQWTLYAGGTNFFSNSDNSTTQVRRVRRIIPHPQAKFSLFEFTYDVVLVELTTPLTITRNVSAMCLPEKDIEPRQLCVIAGWGVSKPGEPNKNLNYLPVPIIDTDECNSTRHYNGLLSKDKICAGYTDSDKTPCYNDEGAPLMCFSDVSGTWELQGILSHHDNCGSSKHPATYTAINDKIKTWLINTVGHKPSRSA